MAVKGLKNVLSNLKKFGSEAAVEIDIATMATALDIAKNAKTLARKDMGKLAQSIYEVKISESDYKVVVGASYGAYVEFGTGKKVQVPTELKEIAIQFKGAGIKQINLQPRPFLYPAFVKGRKQYIKDLKKVLKKLTKKYE